MLGEIDAGRRPAVPRLFLARPDRTIVSKLSEAYSVQLSVKLLAVNELSFRVPYELEVNHRLERNHNVALLREHYYVQVRFGSSVEWYRIQTIQDVMEEEAAYKEVSAYALEYELADKLIRGYGVESVHARQVLQDVLSGTLWQLGSLDADFELTYRAFDFSQTTVLDAVYQVAETYNAIVEFNTEQRTVSMVKPELHGTYRGLNFCYEQYLQTINRSSDAEQQVTRLVVEGRDGLGIQRVHPAGQPYIENYSYFMYPFERNEAREVLQSSYYMSDSLCHAMLDYEAKLEAHRGEFEALTAERGRIGSKLAALEVERSELRKQEKIITDTMIAQQFNGEMFFERYTYAGLQVANGFPLKPELPYAILFRASSTAGLSVAINGAPKAVAAGQWILLGKTAGASSAEVQVSGSAVGVDIYLQVAVLSQEEYRTISNEGAIIERYSLDHKQRQLAAKQAEIDEVQEQQTAVAARISALQTQLGAQAHYTTEQLQELNLYVKTKEFKDERYVDDHDLLQAAQEKLAELQKPQTAIRMDVVDFLDLVEEQGNWDKLRLGDEVKVSYDWLGVQVMAKLIEFDYDYEAASIRVVIAHLRELNDDARKLESYIASSHSTSVTVDLNKHRWGQAVYDASEMSRLFDAFWDKVTSQINMAINETVTLDQKGITITDDQDPARFLRLTHGAIGLTRSGGLRYETALTADGLIAETVLGKLILGSRVTIGDDDGIWMTEGPRTTITDRCGREAMRLGLYETEPDRYGLVVNRYDPEEPCSTRLVNTVRVDSEAGFAIRQRSGQSFEDVAWLGLDGLLHVRKLQIAAMDGMLSSGIEIDSVSGIVVTRSDQRVRGRFNAQDGLVFERYEDGRWAKKFYFEPGGRFYAEDLHAKRLTIVNADDEVLMDARDDYLNIGRFEHIVTDGKLTALEKLVLLQEWETIQTEYLKLLPQAERYRKVQRDGFNRVLVNIPPFTAAYHRLDAYVRPLLAQMEETTAVDRETFREHFQGYYDQARRIMNEIADALQWGSVQLGHNYNKVVIDAEHGITVTRTDQLVKLTMNASSGIKLERSGQPVLFADEKGTLHAVDLVAKRLKITADPFGGGTEDDLLIDAENRMIDLSKFHLIVGKLGADNIASTIVTAEDGFISNLVSNKVKTIGRQAEQSWANYIHIQDNKAMWITGQARAGSGTQRTNALDEPYYWRDEQRSGLTTEVTSYPVMQYEMDERVKMLLQFVGEGAAAYPQMVLGEGDGVADADGVYRKGRGFVEKPQGSLDILYYNQGYGRERSLRMEDEGIKLLADNGKLLLDAKEYACTVSENGSLVIRHSKGSSITMTPEGDIELVAARDVVMRAGRNMKLNGTRLDLNTPG